MIPLYEVIDSHIKRLKNSIHTSIPATVTKVNTEGDNITTISASIVVNKVYSTGDIYKRPDINNIPLLYPSSSDFSLTFPVKVGDTVLLLFSQEDISTFIFEGSTGSNPNTLRKFDINDPIAIPCIHPVNSNIKAHKDNFQITFNDFKLSVKPSGETSLKTNTSVSTNAQNLIESVTERYTVDSNSTEITSDTVSIGNSTVEIVDYLSQLTDEISKITVGGVPIDNLAKFVELKALIDTLK